MNLVPEAVKFATEHPEVFTTAGAFFAGAYADAAKDLANLAGGNQLKAWSLKQMEGILKKSQDKNTKAGIENQPLSPSVGLPLLQAASMETREELLDLWVALLAAAMDPRRAEDVRQSFIETVKKMDPADALVFNAITELQSDTTPTVNSVSGIADRIGRRITDIQVSIENLQTLSCIAI